MSLTGLHLRLKRVEELVSSPVSQLSEGVDVGETLTKALNTLKEASDLNITKVTEAFDNVIKEAFDNAIKEVSETVKTNDLNISKVTEVFNNAVKELSDTVKTNDILDSLELVKEKISVFENELVIIKDSFSSSVKKDEIVDLFMKLEKLEKVVDNITITQESIIERLVSLESK